MKQLIKIMTLLISVSLFATDNQPWYKRLFNTTAWYTGTATEKQPATTDGFSTYFSWIWPKNRGQQAKSVYTEEKKQESHSLVELKKEYAKQHAIIKANVPTSNDTALLVQEKYKKIRDARDKLDTEIIPAIQKMESLSPYFQNLVQERTNLINKYQKLRNQISNLDTIESKLKKEGKKLTPAAQKKYEQARQQLLSEIRPIRERLDQITLESGEYYELKK